MGTYRGLHAQDPIIDRVLRVSVGDLPPEGTEIQSLTDWKLLMQQFRFSPSEADQAVEVLRDGPNWERRSPLDKAFIYAAVLTSISQRCKDEYGRRLFGHDYRKIAALLPAEWRLQLIKTLSTQVAAGKQHAATLLGPILEDPEVEVIRQAALAFAVLAPFADGKPEGPAILANIQAYPPSPAIGIGIAMALIDLGDPDLPQLTLGLLDSLSFAGQVAILRHCDGLLLASRLKLLIKWGYRLASESSLVSAVQYGLVLDTLRRMPEQVENGPRSLCVLKYPTAPNHWPVKPALKASVPLEEVGEQLIRALITPLLEVPQLVRSARSVLEAWGCKSKEVDP